ncbi:MAG: hypothetical protein LBE04_02200 [Prevotellaceae bacterium]|jgi:hypothetical protein|nr:hypothetical protein [Prevotellaceae bacterium]
MKKIHYLLSGGLMIMIVLCFILTACSKKDGDPEKVKVDEIEIDQSELTFIQKGESRDFTVSYTGEWHLEATGLEEYYGPNIASVKDFTVEPASGKGNTKVTVTLTNELTENYNVALKVVAENSQVIVKLKAIAPAD